MHGQQFTPPQLLDGGHRAESEGRLDMAVQFYRHLTEYFPFTPEAAEARNGLGRISASPQPLWQSNGSGHANGSSYANAAARLPRRRQVATQDHYPIGRAVAGLLTMSGCCTVGCGIGAPAAYFGLQHAAKITLPDLTLMQMLALTAAVVGAGLMVVLLGQIARALFDQANASRDLAALERAKVLAD